MRKTNLLILASALFLFCSADLSAQSWLKKISKAVDNAGREIDKQMQKIDETLNTEGDSINENSTPTSVVNQTINRTKKAQNYSGVTIKTFNPQVVISIVSCIRTGDIVTISYTMKNNGPQIQLLSLGTSKSIINPNDDTNIYDDLSNPYKINHQLLGKEFSQRANKTIDVLLIQNVPLKGAIEIKSVDLNARSFSLINIAGLIRNSSQQLQPFSFSFTDLPIYNIEDL